MVKSEDLIERLLAQNDRLIEALAGNSPVEVIRALNPPMVAGPVRGVDAEWSGDPVPDAPADPWGDDSVPLEALRGPISSWKSGWVEGPKPGEEEPAVDGGAVGG